MRAALRHLHHARLSIGPNHGRIVARGFPGALPFAGVIRDKLGNLYGTSYFGGGAKCNKTGRIGCGTVFKPAPDGTETVLFAFYNRRGRYPAAGLLKGPNGLLCGTAIEGGANNDGVVFSVTK